MSQVSAPSLTPSAVAFAVALMREERTRLELLGLSLRGADAAVRLRYASAFESFAAALDELEILVLSNPADRSEGK